MSRGAKVKVTGTDKTDLKTAWRHAHYRAPCGVLRRLPDFPRVFGRKNKKRKLHLEREDECEETSPHNGQGNEPAPRQCAQRAWLHGGRVDSDGGVGQRCVGPRRAQEGRSVKRLVLVARGTNPWCGVCRFTAPPPGHRRSAGPRMSPVRCGLAAAAAAAAARSRACARSLSQPTPMLQTDSAPAFFPRNVARGHATG